MILDRFRLDEQVAIVTGAGRGIALGFAEAGADVVVAARTQEQIDETAHEVEQRGRRAVPVRCDVMERADLENVVATAIERFGKVNVLVNNAGGWPPREALRTSEKSFDEAFHFNVTTAFLLGRIGEVEDIAACALYLASDAASWVTGKIMEVDGGSEWPALEVPVTPL